MCVNFSLNSADLSQNCVACFIEPWKKVTFFSSSSETFHDQDTSSNVEVLLFPVMYIWLHINIASPTLLKPSAKYGFGTKNSPSPPKRLRGSLLIPLSSAIDHYLQRLDRARSGAKGNKLFPSKSLYWTVYLDIVKMCDLTKLKLKRSKQIKLC